MDIIKEIMQFLFVLSLVYIIHIIANFMFKFFNYVFKGGDTKFKLNNLEKILLWISMGFFFTYII